MIKKLKALWSLLQVGQSVADPAKWKKRQITSSMITALLWGLLRLTGMDDQIGSETVDAIAIGALALVNWVLTLSTSKTVGVPAKRRPDPG